MQPKTSRFLAWVRFRRGLAAIGCAVVLVAAPPEYAVTGVSSFIVSGTGVVGQKDLGPGTLDELRVMQRYNLDPTCTPVA